MCRAEENYYQNLAWVDQRPFSFRSRFALANDAFDFARLGGDTNRLAEARRLFRGVADMVPNSYGMLNLLAEVELKTGHPGAALKSLQRSIAITGDSTYSTDAIVLLGEAYRALGQPQRAVDSLPDEVINRYPNRSESYNIRGASYFALGQFFRAINDFSTAIRIDPRRTSAYNDRGQAYAKIGQFELAIADFDQAIGLHPRFALAYYNRALAYVLQGQDAAAERDAAYAVALGFNSVQVKESIDGLKGQGPDQLHQGQASEPVGGVQYPRLLAIYLRSEKGYLGLAVSNPSGRMALPTGRMTYTRFEEEVPRLLAKAGDIGVGGLVVGVPYGPDGASNPRVDEALAFIQALEEQTTLPIYPVNARFPSMEARSMPGGAGGQPSQQRVTINETVATLILQRFLDQQQNRPGDPLEGG